MKIFAAFTILVSIAAGAAQASAGRPVAEEALKVASFEAGVSHNLADFVARLRLPKNREDEVVSVMKERHLEDSALPETRVSGSHLYLTVNHRKVEATFDAKHSQMTINGKTIAFEGRSFATVYKQTLAAFTGISGTQTAFWSQVLLPQADAETVKVQSESAAVTASSIGTMTFGQLFGCAGDSHLRLSTCYFHSDAETLLSYSANYDLKNVNCDKGQLKTATFIDKHDPTSGLLYEFKPASSGKPADLTIRFASSHSPYCQYKLKDDLAIASVQDPTAHVYCGDPGQSVEEVHGNPFSRVVSCCGDDKCAKELQDGLAKRTREASSATTAPGTSGRPVTR